jgi:Uma2 family endonuclease
MNAVIDQEASLPRDALLRRWQDVLADPQFRRTPYRVELNRWGTIEKTPVKPHHSRVAKRLAQALESTLGGEAYTELAIALPSGLRVPDVAWCSAQFLSRHAQEFAPGSLALSVPPDVCVEVMSESNTLGELKEKAAAYVEAGAKEAWIVLQDLSILFYDASGQRPDTAFDVDLSGWRREFVMQP